MTGVGIRVDIDFIPLVLQDITMTFGSRNGLLECR